MTGNCAGGESLKPIDLATAESMKFIEGTMSVQSVSVLEVGAGNGDLSYAMMQSGARVRAVDYSEEAVAAARLKGVDARQANFLDYQDEPFDVVLFTRSLHHIHPLEKAVRKAAELLKPAGRLLIEEFGAELVDDATLNWLNGWLLEIAPAQHDANQQDANQQDATQHDAKGPHSQHDRHRAKTESCESWHRHHFEDHKISDSASVLRSLTEAFKLQPIQTVPYLYRYAIDSLPKNYKGYKALARMFAEEKELLEKGILKPIGFYVVGNRK